MAAKLYVAACRNFAPEFEAAIAAEGWDDVVAVAFDARCGRPPLAWDELAARVPADAARIVVHGRACLQGLGDAPPGMPPARLAPVSQCFDLIAGAGVVADALAGGAYLVTPGWLRDWPAHLAALGFDEAGAAEFFREFARELVLLDTGVDGDASERLQALARATGLPARRIGVGLDHVRAQLARRVLEWRLDEARREAAQREQAHAREHADHVSAMDLLARMAGAATEADAIEAIADMYRMLFAPGELHYARVDRGTVALPDACPPGLERALRELSDPWAWTPSGEGFVVRIARGDDLFGVIAADRLAFPAFRERYLNLALSTVGVCALAIENARTRRRLVEAEKMASLGIMVAGVAHEVNTPVGVAMIAVSTMQDRAAQIARLFELRTLTQPDLARFLDDAKQAGALVRSSLERIGRLTQAFRQVAIDGTPPRREAMRVRGAIDEAVAGFADRLAAAGVRVRVECDEALAIDSYPGDWATILANLLSNSLRHGFRGRAAGAIDVRAGLRGGLLVVEYEDDGAGFAHDALARIFDPFFTTDMQSGTGLGMHLVYNLVTQRLRGHIAAESRAGGGARFVIEVPA
ncbi:MAG: ATP-binding protein [Burkholderiaceae bacterium]